MDSQAPLKELFDLTARTVLVTGGTRGLGKTIALTHDWIELPAGRRLDRALARDQT